ncbi:L-amino acid N-acyltransferase YncA [Virgibacillus halotolerans]|uniref:GNAT family N-acetyltransferase n=1 Tax=Virgibacillus halotolerans TaxID=1071053 RepID=UPI0019613BEC|nr:GNAT family N-acetyltransferase [Virgibacillus halotolerans]MBM7600196.1 L-amino acid N-acyltransferase YncA [Virgibacillus halotolerans]
MYSIRRATLEDADTITTIHVKSWKSTYSELLDQEDLSNITYENRRALWEAVLSMEKKGTCTFVIYDEKQIVGFVSGGPERTKRFGYDSEIYNIYLLDEFQKKGLGARLLNAFAKEMKELGHESILVWVLKQNPSSRFYERYHAEPVGEEITTIGDGRYQETAYGWKHIDALLDLLHLS